MSAESVMGGVIQSVVRRWLEVLLPVYTAGFLLVWLQPEYTPEILTQSMGVSLLPWIAWAVVGAMTGILGLWALIVAFFLLYSPIYLLGKSSMLIGKGAWVDKGELRFYLSCFVVLCLVAVLFYWMLPAGLIVFALVAGCGPMFWRALL